jgi:hypothetical protein
VLNPQIVAITESDVISGRLHNWNWRHNEEWRENQDLSKNWIVLCGKWISCYNLHHIRELLNCKWLHHRKWWYHNHVSHLWRHYQRRRHSHHLELSWNEIGLSKCGLVFKHSKDSCKLFVSTFPLNPTFICIAKHWI